MYARERAPSAGIGSAVLAVALCAALPASADLNLGPEELVYTDIGVVQVPGWSVPSFTYWDGDELNDLIIGEGGYVSPGMVRVYLNIGTLSEPRFSDYFYAQSNGADLSVPGQGCQGAFPRVIYWDADERKDLLVGQADGRVKLFLNIGTDDDPTFDGGTFLQVGEPGFKVDINVGPRATPTVADWNNDARKDLVVGALDGRIRVFLNEGTHTEPDFRVERLAELEDGGALMVPTGRSSPVIRDLDDDGRKDLLTGNTEGQLLLYRNTGSDDAPAFSPDYVLVRSDGIPIDLTGEPRSRPSVCDWTDDGLPDVLIGAGDGQVHLYQGVPELVRKWSQPPDDCSVNFDAAADLWWPDPDSDPHLPVSKWEQRPDPDLPGLRAHDWLEIPSGYRWVMLADDWECEGGDVTDLHWWGNYELDAEGQEIRGAGIDHFHLSIHICGGGEPWCLPEEPPQWVEEVPSSALNEVDTGVVNIEGSPIYLYAHELPTPFLQEAGAFYWLDITAVAVDPGNPPTRVLQGVETDLRRIAFCPAPA